jgi:hypothetical protein
MGEMEEEGKVNMSLNALMFVILIPHSAGGSCIKNWAAWNMNWQVRQNRTANSQ